MKAKLRNLFKMLLAWTILLFLVMVVIEVVLQVRNSIRLSNKAESGIVDHTANEVFGTWRMPNQENKRWESDCFETADININSYGMRAEEPNPKKKKRVGWFGDSMIQGYEVSKDEHFLYRLNQHDKEHDHLNFGIAATGTITQHQNFLYHAKKLELDEVVLCLYLSNDVWNNSYEISITDGWELDKPVPFMRQDSEGNNYLDRSRIDWHTRWYGKLHTVKILAGMLQRLGTKMQYRSGFNPYSYRCPGVQESIDFNKQRFCKECAHPWWEAARETTKAGIRAFADDCRERNLPFKVLFIPAQEELLTNAQVIERNPTAGKLLDYELENRMFTEFLDAEGIEYLNLLPYAQQRVKQYSMDWPFFSLECDMHFSAQGHDLLFDAANSMY